MEERAEKMLTSAQIDYWKRPDRKSRKKKLKAKTSVI